MKIKLIIPAFILLIFFFNSCDKKEVEMLDLIECLQKEKVLDSLVSDSIIYITLTKELSSKLETQDCYKYSGSKKICLVTMDQIFFHVITEYIILNDVKILNKDRFKFYLIYKYNSKTMAYKQKYDLEGNCNGFILDKIE